MEVVTLETPSLGDRSYLVSDGSVAVVVDPQRDIGRVLDAADARGVRITHVLETHVHNDYVSGGFALAGNVGADYVLAAAEDAEFDHTGVADGDEIMAGDIRLRVLHTPGHTPHHLSYVLLEDDVPTAVFTGGSLLYGAVGRPDLISADLAEELGREQYRSAHRLADELPDDATVHPTHGFGSHCATTTDEVRRDGTVADELDRNPALLADDEDRFVEEMLSGLHPYPAYYAHMGPRNRAGPPEPDLTAPEELDPDRLRKHIEAGDWVVDLRPRRTFSKVHVAGTVNVELRDDLPTYLGWIFPYDRPLILLADTPDDIAGAQTMLARIGIDDPAGALTGDPSGWLASDDQRRAWPVGNWQDLADAMDEGGDVAVLDVRERWEWEESHHPDAVHLPFYELAERVGEVPDGEVWVYCATGNRATVASSLLEKAGRDVVLLDDFCLPGDTPWR